VTQRPTLNQDRSRDPQHDAQHDAQRLAARQATAAPSKPTSDPLAALERARRHAFEAQEAERWDGLS